MLKNVKENIKIIGDLLGESYDVCDQMIKCTLFNEHDINNKKKQQQQPNKSKHICWTILRSLVRNALQSFTLRYSWVHRLFFIYVKSSNKL